MVQNNVDIYTTKYLAQRFCKGECWLNDCEPKFFAQGILGLGLTVRVKGNIPQSECPIANRKFPSTNFSPVMGSGDCGETPTENPITLNNN